MRYPLQPLLDAAGLSLAGLNARIRMGGDTYRRIQVEGLSELMADRWSVRLGMHPAEVWPEFLGPAEKPCAAPDCDQTFPVRTSGKGGHNRRWCSEACRGRQKMRAYRATPEGREANRRYLAEYRAYLQRRREAA